MSICILNWVSINAMSLLIGFILGIGAGVVANWAISLACCLARKSLRKNMNIALTYETIPHKEEMYWCVNLQAKGSLWSKLTFNQVTLELYAKVKFEQLDNSNKCLGFAYDTTVDIEEKSILFKLKANYPKRLAIMYRPSMGDWLHPFRTTFDFELKGNWNAEIYIIEDGQKIKGFPLPKFIQDSKPVIEKAN